MKSANLFVLAALAATPAMSENVQQLGAHEHGVGSLDIAIEGQNLAMAFSAPAADIVGFEYAPKSEEDHAAIDAALELLKDPLSLFALPQAASCEVTQAKADLEGHDDEHDDEGHEDHDHDDHAHSESKDHDHDGHEDHEETAAHSEFSAEYAMSCSNIDALAEITFGYFEAFPNALEVDVRIITDAGASAFEVPRDAPILDLSALK